MYLFKYRFDAVENHNAYVQKSKELLEWVKSLERPVRDKGRVYEQRRYGKEQIPRAWHKRIIKLDSWFATQDLNEVVHSYNDGWEVIFVSSIDTIGSLAVDEAEDENKGLQHRATRYTYLVLIEDLCEATEMRLLYG
jgi:hypothetical protein